MYYTSFFDFYLTLIYNFLGSDDMNTFYELFLYFFIYSVIGWFTEMIYCRLCDGKWSDRGFLYGPYCPIYGFGGLIVLIFLEPISNYTILVFLLAIILTTILEYITSFLMEKFFDAKWWDYSERLLNINGRICLLNSILFGFLGLIITYIIHPYIKVLVNYIPVAFVQYIVLIIMIILSIDFTITLNSLLNFKDKLKEIESIKETLKEKSNSTNKIIYTKIEELKQNLIEKRLKLSDKRFIKAFPRLKFNKLNNAFEEIKIYIEKQTQERIEKKKSKNK